MLGVAYGAVLEGIAACPVRVEADVSQGLPLFSIVGLPDSAVQESKLRIRAAMKNSGLPFPSSRITINLSPANMKKRGPGLDLAIAVAILNAVGYLNGDATLSSAFCGELGLSGDIAPVVGVVNLALALHGSGMNRIVLSANQMEGIVPIPAFEWIAAHTLLEVVDICKSNYSLGIVLPGPLPHPGQGESDSTSLWTNGNVSEVRGLTQVKRALLIAATGRHHSLLFGPPGCGKTMLAERFHTILPPLTPEQALEAYAIHQACDVPRRLDALPPVRSPHHTVTRAGLIGGGSPPVPGEVTLAHHGVLLLDEILEFQRTTLESLREPLGSRTVRVTRGGYRSVFPADFLLLGTLNPCPCGQHGFGHCTCLPTQIHRYWSSLSGPLIDRMELIIPVHPEPRATSADRETVSSEDLRKKAEQARAALMEREQWLGHGRSSDVSSEAMKLVLRAGEKIPLSTRGIHGVLRVARTISALDGSQAVEKRHIEEGLAYRSLTRP